MANFLDILSGRIFNFRNATGADVNAGTSDKLIVTPKAIAQSNAMSNTSISLVLPSLLTSKITSFVANPYVFVIPTNGYFFPNRQAKMQAQLFVYVIADAACTGEICLVDALTNTIVPNTTFSFTNNSWVCVNGTIIELEAGKIYTIALRRSLGSSSKLVQLRAATLTIKLLSI
jgi:hypothetical protein